MVRKAGKTVYGRFNKRDSDNALAEAIKYHQAGDIKRAAVIYMHILESSPDNPEVLHLIGVTFYQEGDNTKAKDYIERAISIKPDASAYYFNLGNVYTNTGEHDRAMECFREAIRIDPGNAEAYNNIGNALRVKGDNDGAIASYEKAIIHNPEYAIVYNNYGNLLKDMKRFDEAVTAYRKAIALAPGLAVAYYNLAFALAELDKLDEALEQYRICVSLRPDFYAAFNDMGNVYKCQNKLKEAESSYTRSIELNSDFAPPYNNMADVCRISGRYADAITLCKKAVKLEPYNEQFYVNSGNIYYDFGDMKMAVANYDKAIELKQDYSDAHYNRGLALLLQGNFKEGWSEYEWRLRCSEISTLAGIRDAGFPSWEGSSLQGKTLLVIAEQGIGDSIQFARFLPILKSMGATVLLECREELRRLMQLFNGVDELLEGVYKENSCVVPDLQVNLLSLPALLNVNSRKDISAEPYLSVMSGDHNKWQSIVRGDFLKVGVIWSGNPSHRRDNQRSCRLNNFAKLFDHPGVSFYSFQKEVEYGDRATLREYGIPVLGDRFTDFYDTAAAISCMDLVITVDTAIAHLAGALGIRVWTMIPYVPDWRWMNKGNTTYWYSSMRLFRQIEFGNWRGVIDSMTNEIKQLPTMERSAQ
ncbi:MAG: tetratricopeptide repeat protein [Nitrospira sp.]|nr:tetratricopeptide repeat protein [Nitrospira sp.]